MADKKFGQKRTCPHCEKKFYDLNKKSPLKCPCGEKEIVIEDDSFLIESAPIIQQQGKNDTKDEFADIDNPNNSDSDSDDEVISLDDAALEEEQQDHKS
jgi:hypothetical protein